MNHLKSVLSPSTPDQPPHSTQVCSTGLSDALFHVRSITIRYSRQEWLFVGLAFIGLFLLSSYLLTIGSYRLSLEQLLAAIFGDVLGSSTPLDEHQQAIVERVVFHIRMPRILTALFVGMALGVSGAVFQSISRNALGSPDIIGFTTGAATGALIQIIVFQHNGQSIILAALLGGLLTSIVVYLLARKSGTVGGYRLILTGIGVGSILSAINSFLLVKGNLDQAVTANLWLAGSLNGRTWYHALSVMIGVLVIVPIIISKARTLHLIEMGDDMAAQIGVAVERERLIMTFLAVMLAALATGAAGPISFIALAAPQLAARLLRTGHLAVAASAVIGAGLILIADFLSQLKPWNVHLPIGLVTSLIGGIYLLWLLSKSKNI